MTNTRTHPVNSGKAHARAVGEYRRDGYRVVSDTGTETVLENYDRGGLLTHLALFFTIGWVTFGILNVWYANRRKRRTHDRVRVVSG